MPTRREQQGDPAPARERARQVPHERALQRSDRLGHDLDRQARCDGTLTHAIKDEVQVTDFVRHKTIILHAGQSYLAPGPFKRP